MFISNFALFLIKALQKSYFFLYFFALILTIALPKRMCFSIFALTLTKALPQRVFLYFCPYLNQNHTNKGVSSIFALILIKALPKRVFYSFFALILTKASIFALTLTKDLSQRVFFSIFALILTKALPKRVYSQFLPLF